MLMTRVAALAALLVFASGLNLRQEIEAENAIEKTNGTEPEKLPPVTLVLMDGRYSWPKNGLDAGFNCWAERFAKHGKKMPLHVVGLDNAAAQYLKNWTSAHPDVTVKVDNSYAKYMPKEVTVDKAHGTLSFRKRSNAEAEFPSEFYSKTYWKAMEKTLAAGHPEVLHADLDTYYEKDPWELLDHEDFAGYDLVASPQQCHLDFKFDQRRADICTGMNSTIMVNTGFVLFRKSPQVMELMKHFNAAWDKDVKSSKDDRVGSTFQNNEQFMLNDYLSQQGCHWQRPRYHGLLRGTCGKLKVAFLKKTAIQRGAGTKMGKYVTHARDEGELVMRKYCAKKD